MEYNLTNKGINLILRSMAGTTITFSEVQFGNGSAPSPSTADAIGNAMLTMGIDGITVLNGYAEIACKFKNSAVTAGFRRTEAGVYTKDPDNATKKILFAYGTSLPDEADYIPTAGDEILETQFSLKIFVGNTENVTAIINESLVYASKVYVDAHKNDKGNPHGVTAQQVGAAPTNHGHSFDSLSGLPKSFPPASHGHSFSSLTGLPAAFPPTSDRRGARVVIGSAGAGYTAVQCDYLCDGVNDEAEFNAAVRSLTNGGGRIEVLDGTYNIAADILLTKPLTELAGTAGARLVFTSPAGLKMTGSGCTVTGLTLDGSQSSTSTPVLLAQGCDRAELSGLRVTAGAVKLDACTNALVQGNFIGQGNGYNHGVVLTGGRNNTVTGNNLSGAYYGVEANAEKQLIISQNSINAFNEYGIYATLCEDLTITGNNVETAVGGYILGIRCDQSRRVMLSANSVNMTQTGSSGQCIYFSAVTQGVVSNNFVRSTEVTSAVVGLYNCVDILVMGNAMSSNFGTKLEYGGSQNITDVYNVGYRI